MKPRFWLSESVIDPSDLLSELDNPTCGAAVTFDGRVRDHNEGRGVLRLDYQAHRPLATTEGQAVIDEAMQRFAVQHVLCVHRIGSLQIGDIAVWVGACAAHRDAAFEATRFVIDEIKKRVPIWKNEFYVDGSEAWVDPTKSATTDPHAPSPLDS